MLHFLVVGRERDVSFLDFSVRLKAGIHRLCHPLRHSSVALFVFNSSLVLVRTVGQLYPSNSPFDKSETSQSRLELRSTVMCIHLLSPL